jgi:hypothetical protein
LRYKFLITHNTKIPHEEKEALIASKRDEMVRMRNMGHVFSQGTFDPFQDFSHFENQYSNSFNNNVDDDIDDITFQPPVDFSKKIPLEQNISRDGAYAILIELIFSHYDEFNVFCNVEGLVMSIQQYMENTIDEIILQSDICWSVRQNIELFSHEDEITKEQLKKIFVPDSIEEYNTFVEIIECQKSAHEIDELEKINEEIQLQNEIEEQKKLKEQIKEKRNALMNHLLSQLTRLGAYDIGIKGLKISIETPIQQYIDLITDFVFVENELYDQIIKFIKQIRLDATIKDELTNIIKKL